MSINRVFGSKDILFFAHTMITSRSAWGIPELFITLFPSVHCGCARHFLILQLAFSNQ
jgi:hypothetical protein